MQTELPAPTEVAPVVTPLKGGLILIAVVILVAGFLALARFAGVTSIFPGSVFALLWGAVYRSSFKELPQVIAGSLFGLALGYIYQVAPLYLPKYGMAIALVAIIFAVYCLIVGWLPIVINSSAMLFLTLGTIPEVQARENFGEMALSVLLAVVYLGGLAYLLARAQAFAANRTLTNRKTG
jgi:hypothetical protein